ncbi:hypothetical protein EDC04DRAFT_681030 [Pisolithus marmoratus]|nr:hypothetical protein EDC04DRAFT_681030 [Pisolithus marmoratus]
MTLRYVCMRLVRQLSCLFALQSFVLVCCATDLDVATAESYRRCCEAVGPTITASIRSNCVLILTYYVHCQSIFALAFIRHSDKVERFRQVSHFKKALVYLLCYLIPCLDIYCFHDQHA